MGVEIQIKRGSGAPTSLKDGELAFDRKNSKLYIGKKIEGSSETELVVINNVDLSNYVSQEQLQEVLLFIGIIMEKNKIQEFSNYDSFINVADNLTEMKDYSFGSIFMIDEIDFPNIYYKRNKEDDEIYGKYTKKEALALLKEQGYFCTTAACFVLFDKGFFNSYNEMGIYVEGTTE